MTTRVVCQSCGQEQEIEAGQGAKEGFREYDKWHTKTLLGITENVY